MSTQNKASEKGGSRRSNGLGTEPKQLPSKSWRGQVWVEKPDGTRERRSVTGRTKTEVQRRYRELIAEAAAGLDVSRTGKVSVQTFADEWLQHRARRLKASTIKEDAGVLRTHVLLQIRGRAMASITAKDIERILTADRIMERSPRTRAKTFAVMSSMFRDAERDGVIVSSPTRKVRTPSTARRQPRTRAMTVEEMELVLDDAHRRGPTAEWRTVLAFLGLRAAEVLALDWDDLDIEKRVLTIRRSRTRHIWVHGVGCESMSSHTAPKCPTRRKNTLTDVPKTIHSAREIPLADEHVRLAVKARAEQDEWRRLRGQGKTPHPELPRPMFPLRDGVSPTGVVTDSMRWKDMLQRLGIGGANLHTSRHTAATLMLEKGASIATVQAILGHAALASTAAYLHGQSAPSRAAVASIMSGGVGDAGAERRAAIKEARENVAKLKAVIAFVNEHGPQPTEGSQTYDRWCALASAESIDLAYASRAPDELEDELQTWILASNG